LVARVGVLALQGDVREHVAALRAAGAEPVEVRRSGDLAGLDGIVLPGGESTTMGKLLRIFELLEPLRALVAGGLPTYGTCAGMILLASEVVDGRRDQELLGGLDITVRRNGTVHGVFIRAPWVERAGPGVRVLASVGEHPVAVQQGHLLATSFHPELTGDERMHAYFVRRLVPTEGGTP
jgi:5'-phosphate synthase pdxT subunit